jgi:hypothetical protein
MKTITALLAEGMSVTSTVENWNVNATVEEFFEMGAITVTVK